MFRRGQRPAVTDTDTGKRSWQILAVVLTGSFMAVLDTTIVNVALPSIQQGAHASSDALEWVVSGYALTFGLALVPAAGSATGTATNGSSWPGSACSRWPAWPAGSPRTRAS